MVEGEEGSSKVRAAGKLGTVDRDDQVFAGGHGLGGGGFFLHGGRRGVGRGLVGAVLLDEFDPEAHLFKLLFGRGRLRAVVELTQEGFSGVHVRVNQQLTNAAQD